MPAPAPPSPVERSVRLHTNRVPPPSARWLAPLALALLLAGAAVAGEEPATPAEIARAAAAARTSGDTAALKRLAGDGGDATIAAINAALAADDLETAKALAAEAPASFAEALLAYAEARATDHAPKSIGLLFEVAKQLAAARRGADGVLVYRRAIGFATERGVGQAVAAGRIYEARALLPLGRAEEALAAADAGSRQAA